MDSVTRLAEEVRNHVPEQPWSYYGNQPAPVEMYWDGTHWQVRFVTGLQGSRRVWKRASGVTAHAALSRAREIQLGGER